MAEGRIERRLAAIVIADVVGYSRLVREDEAGTLARFQRLQEKIFQPRIREFGGRLVKTMGDSYLLEFPSAVAAVECCTAIQKAMLFHESETPEEKRIRFRVGINVGDIVVDGEDIHGDGVNVAARLESMAEPSGILISSTVHDQVRDKLDLIFEDNGEVEVKNIVRPVRVYSVLQGARAARTSTPAVSKVANPWMRQLAIAGAFLLLSIIAGAVIWQQPWRTRVEAASPERMAYPLPQKPSIVVLPFANLSGDKDRDYLADGFTDNITARLSQMPQLFVISRSSAVTYKKKDLKAGQIAEQLGVRYILDGSVNQAGDALRVNTQLIDAISGFHIWSKTYDRQMKDVLGAQDAITHAIAVALHINIVEGAADRSIGATNNAEA